MKVYLLQDVENVGFSGEVLSVKDGFARNFLFPKKLALEITRGNKNFFESRARKVENRKAALESEQSMLSQKIADLTITLKEKVHDDNKLYAAINAKEIVEALAEKGITVSARQVLLNKSIKSLGEYKVVIKLSSKLQPELTVKVSKK